MKTHIWNFILVSFILFLFITPARSQAVLYSNEFNLEDVTLLESPFKKAMDLNINTLLSYDLPRLLQPFYKQSGLNNGAAAFSNWSGLDGHVGGHYLTALSIHYAACKDAAKKTLLKTRIDQIVKGLKTCQDASAKLDTLMIGYVGGVPDSKTMWTTFYKGDFTSFNSGWVPWYNMHKTYAGLRDAWVYTGDTTAKNMFIKLCDWGIKITSKLSDSQMQTMLNIEHGGMNEVYADAYQITGNQKYLDAAKKFSHQSLLASMVAKNASSLNNLHANTQIPKVIGFQRIFENFPSLTNYGNAASFFWDEVVNNRTLALGGNSRSEHFIAPVASKDYIETREGPESCNTNNMLKLTEDLFRTSPQAKYADFFEQALYNHILSTQHPEHGGYVYFTPARPQHYRVYSAVNQAMWCCVGSGMENHGKYGQFIYSHKSDSLFVNLFIPSILNWQAKGCTISQETGFPFEEKTILKVNTTVPVRLTIMPRHPSWVAKDSFRIKINNVVFEQNSNPQSFAVIDRVWNDGDVIEISLPMQNTFKQLPNVKDYVALMHGPILLGAETGEDDLDGLVAGEGRWEHIANGALYGLNRAPVLLGNRADFIDSLKVVNKDSMLFSASALLKDNYGAKWNNLKLKPFYEIHDARYMMYWMQLTKEEYAAVFSELAKEENEKLEIEKYTIDQISCGEQQPDKDHNATGTNSTTGVYKNVYYRDATAGGWFSYEMDTKGFDTLKLKVTYWGNESGNRAFDIVVEDDTIFSENISGKFGISEFRTADYIIPVNTVKGKNIIKVKFDAKASCIAGGVYHIRLMRDMNRDSLYDARVITLAEIDAGYPTSESKFGLSTYNSNTGTANNQTWRDATSGGYIKYTVQTGGSNNLFIRVRYWGNETGNRKFDIFAGADTMATENIVGKWNSGEFKEVDYHIPSKFLDGKSKIDIKFKPRAFNLAGGLYYVWVYAIDKKIVTDITQNHRSSFSVVTGNDRLMIRIPNGNDGDKLRIFDLNGELIYSGSVNGQYHEISTVGFNKNQAYILLYSGKLNIETCKVVVK